MYNQSKTQCAACNFFHLGGDSFCARVHVDDGTRAPLPTLFLVFSRATLQKLFFQASSFCLKQAPTLVAVTESRSTWCSKWCLATPFLNSFPCWSWSSGACSQSFQPTTQPNFSPNSPLLWEGYISLDPSSSKRVIYLFLLNEATLREDIKRKKKRFLSDIARIT